MLLPVITRIVNLSFALHCTSRPFFLVPHEFIDAGFLFFTLSAKPDSSDTSIVQQTENEFT